MVRLRTSPIVVSQQDIRQTTLTQPLSPTSDLSPHVYCCWCRHDGRRFACLAQSSVVCDEPEPQLVHRWSLGGEGWVPISGPCCEDCLKATFHGEATEECLKGEGSGGRCMRRVLSCCRRQNRQMRNVLLRVWNQVCIRLQNVRLLWVPSNLADKPAVDDAWRDVNFEAEGFLEVTVVVTGKGVTQHMEVDFPTDIPINSLKLELATLISVTPERQVWSHVNQALDDTKTLLQQGVDTGSVIEVKCCV